jgi:hypothetical protein
MVLAASAALLLAAIAGLPGCASESGTPEASDAAGTTSAPATDGSTATLTLPEGSSAYVEGTDTYPVPDLELPAKGATILEPDFGTPITRLTEHSVDGYAGPGIQNEYSRVDPENAGGTLAMLRANEGDRYLLDLGTGELESLEHVFTECDQEPEPRWDAEDAGLFYFVCGTELRAHDVHEGVSRTVHDFADVVPGAVAVRTRSEGDASLDRRYWAFTADGGEGEALALVTYDLRDDEVVGVRSELPDDVDWIGMAASGEHVLVGWESLSYLEVLPLDLVEGYRLPEGSNAHGDRALDRDGQDVWVYQDTATDFISMADLATGEVTRLLEIPFGVNTDIGLHFSGNGSQTPGWALVSTYGAVEPAGERHSWMDNQLFMLELASPPRVWRLAHTRCYTAETAEADPMYFAEAFAALNRDSSRVYFGSNWGDLSPDYTDAYVLSLPAGWAQKLHE